MSRTFEGTNAKFVSPASFLLGGLDASKEGSWQTGCSFRLISIVGLSALGPAFDEGTISTFVAGCFLGRFFFWGGSKSGGRGISYEDEPPSGLGLACRKGPTFECGEEILSRVQHLHISQ